MPGAGKRVLSGPVCLVNNLFSLFSEMCAILFRKQNGFLRFAESQGGRRAAFEGVDGYAAKNVL